MKRVLVTAAWFAFASAAAGAQPQTTIIEAVSGAAPIDKTTQTEDILFKKDSNDRMTVPVLLSHPGASYQVSNLSVGDFAAWSASPLTAALVGNFDGNGGSDIALSGAAGWATVPVAVSHRLMRCGTTISPERGMLSQPISTRPPCV